MFDSLSLKKNIFLSILRCRLHKRIWR